MIQGTDVIDLHIEADILARRAERVIMFTGVMPALAIHVLHLVDQGVTQPTALAIRLDRPSPTISHAVRDLQERGLLSSTKSEDDGRVKILEVTPYGKSILSVIDSALEIKAKGTTIDHLRSVNAKGRRLQ
jgi:DNA-binding MarR family transcriptional regulator